MQEQYQLLLVLIVYMSFIIGLGVYMGRKVKNTSDYAIAGRKLPGWVAALSERATGESSWALLGLPGAAYATGLVEIWTAIGCVTGIILAWIFLAWRIRNEAEKYSANTLPADMATQVNGYVSRPHLSSFFSSFSTSELSLLVVEKHSTPCLESTPSMECLWQLLLSFPIPCMADFKV
jgi:Na+/pantothenate symporter